jgi:hypothetical protein
MFPAINVAEASTASFGDSVDGDTIDNGFRLNDAVTWVKGRNEFKIGYEQWYQQYSPLDYDNQSGTFDFGRAQTAADPVTASTQWKWNCQLAAGRTQFRKPHRLCHSGEVVAQLLCGFHSGQYKGDPHFDS